MNLQTMRALIVVELKKLYRDPMTLGILLLMPVGLTLVFYFAFGDIRNDYYGYASEMSHFDYLLPGAMGYAIIKGVKYFISECELHNTDIDPTWKEASNS